MSPANAPRLGTLLATAAAIVACGPSTPVGLMETPNASTTGCDEEVAIIECPDTNGVLTWKPLDYAAAGGVQHDLNLYAAYGDPSPGADGVWLGYGVTPSACILGVPGGTSDRDADRLRDSCEFALARAFSPYLQFTQGERIEQFEDGSYHHCAKGEPYWAVKPFFYTPLDAVVVNLGYLPAYYLDCGEDVSGFSVLGHAGDSEVIRLSVRYRTATRHWELTHAFLSAHYNSDSNMGSSRYAEPNELQYPKRFLTFPKVWVSRNKHANYVNHTACNTGGAVNSDTCNASSDLYQARFPVRSDRNIGSATTPLVPCVPSLYYNFFPTITECFYSAYKAFGGWQNHGLNDLTGEAYRTLLFTGRVFETLHPDARFLWSTPTPPTDPPCDDPLAITC